MNKKIMIGIAIAIIAIIVGIVGYIKIYGETQPENVSNNQQASKNNEEQQLSQDDNKNQQTVNQNNIETGKILVVYYSAQSHTKAVAEKIATNLNADIFEIEPKQAYTTSDLDWTNNNSRVSKEHNDNSLRNIELNSTKIDNWDSYDTVLIGYPIWWGISAWPVDTFVKANDFNGKTVIPFCTSASSGLGESGKLLEAEAKGGNWIEGQRFNSNPTDSDIKKFTDNIKSN